jgi:hypothetical protein
MKCILAANRRRAFIFMVEAKRICLICNVNLNIAEKGN